MGFMNKGIAHYTAGLHNSHATEANETHPAGVAVGRGACAPRSPSQRISSCPGTSDGPGEGWGAEARPGLQPVPPTHTHAHFRHQTRLQSLPGEQTLNKQAKTNTRFS